ncbi:MAG: DGQHR domain-containing protein [Sphaerochaetaceae bacterium]|nr:DGQHR domain-containing protein [uncultured Sphaerochaeta sp.]MDC7230644.1 DGQHR domain-containing protein [Sphaerochaetaceae bacterium]
MVWTDGLIYGDQIKRNQKVRSDQHVHKSINKTLTNAFIEDGWELQKEFKTVNKMRRLKPLDEQFIDEIWVMLASLGFEILNHDNPIKIPFDDKKADLAQQIDVFAMDDETILFIKCKCSENWQLGDFKDDLVKMNGYRGGLIQTVKNAFPDQPKRKPKFVLATKNYQISDQDSEIMKSFGIAHHEAHTIRYYTELVSHLGSAARYQFLSKLFEGQCIGAMENKVPAIRGKMGGTTYYSFTIEPEKLLKISYVLHRTEANDDMMPSYQRIIKKNRLKAIRQFINNGGYFPNSIIVSLNTGEQTLRFDSAPKELRGDSDRTKIGILHLPQCYGTAYIIDGQHRLYGYTSTKYLSNNEVPVVAFENLDRTKQVELFMQINENQKSVPKNLRNTLNADLLWDDGNLNNRRLALRQRIAIRFGERQTSPLYQRIRIGENERDSKALITIDTIENAIKLADFLNIYSKDNKLSTQGTFDSDDCETTLNNLYSYLENVFSYIKNNLIKDWEGNKDGKDVLTSNNSIHAIIRILNDVVNHLVKQKALSIPVNNIHEAFENTKCYVDPLISYYQSISIDQKTEIRTSYGSGGKTKVWRIYQKVISDSINIFNPDGLEDWKEKNTTEYNVESFRMINEIETRLNKDFREKLESEYGQSWFTSGVSKSVYDNATRLARDKDYENNLPVGTTNPWDCLVLINYREIAIHGKNWQTLFEKCYTRPGEQKISGGKTEKTKWMVQLNTIRNKSHHNNPVGLEDFNFLSEIYKWLVVTKKNV